MALGRLAGNSSRSTQRAVYQPPRCQPICTSHGHTRSGGAGMVTAWLVTTVGWSTSSSPGSIARRSARVDPAVRPSHSPAATTPTDAATAVAHPHRDRQLASRSSSLPIVTASRSRRTLARPPCGRRPSRQRTSETPPLDHGQRVRSRLSRMITRSCRHCGHTLGGEPLRRLSDAHLDRLFSSSVEPSPRGCGGSRGPAAAAPRRPAARCPAHTRTTGAPGRP